MTNPVILESQIVRRFALFQALHPEPELVSFKEPFLVLAWPDWHRLLWLVIAGNSRLPQGH